MRLRRRIPKEPLWSRPLVLIGASPDAGSARNGRDIPLTGLANPTTEEFSKGNFKFCPNDRVPELARVCSRNAQWITPNG